MAYFIVERLKGSRVTSMRNCECFAISVGNNRPNCPTTCTFFIPNVRYLTYRKEHNFRRIHQPLFTLASSVVNSKLHSVD
jgi:hypothetical protein